MAHNITILAWGTTRARGPGWLAEDGNAISAAPKKARIKAEGTLAMTMNLRRRREATRLRRGEDDDDDDDDDDDEEESEGADKERDGHRPNSKGRTAKVFWFGRDK